MLHVLGMFKKMNFLQLSAGLDASESFVFFRAPQTSVVEKVDFFSGGGRSFDAQKVGFL